MRHKVISILAVISVLLSLSSPAEAQNPLCPTEGIVNQEELADLVDCIADGLAIVWEDDIKASVQLAYPGVTVLSDVPLIHDESCNWRPELRNENGQPQIRYGKTLIYYSMALQQAQVFYLLGIKPVDDPEAVFEYFDDTLLPVMRNDASKCRRSGPNTRGYPYFAVPTILHGKINKTQYAEIIAQLRQNSVADKLQAYVGGFPMFFAVLHEAGHVVLHAEIEENLPHHEPEADTFAQRVSMANDLPTVLGLGHFQLFYGNNRDRHNTAIACRLVSLAETGPTPRSFAQEFGTDVWQRSENLRKAYIAHYRKSCDE